MQGNEGLGEMSESIKPSSTSGHKQSQPLYRFCKPSLFLPRRRVWNANTDLRWGRQNNNAKRNPDRD